MVRGRCPASRWRLYRHLRRHARARRGRSRLNESRICYEHITTGWPAWSGPPWHRMASRRPPAWVDFNAALERVRGEVAVLQLRLQQVRNAPPPPEEIRAMIRAELTRRRQCAGFGHKFTRD